MAEEEKGKLKHFFESREKYKEALNAAPNPSWIKERGLGGSRKSKYLPIEIQQALTDVLFDEFDIFEEQYTQIENEILCTVKISYLPSYPYADYRSMSGTGAKPIAASSGSIPAKFPRGKIPNALEYCAPNARISAISNALATCGNVFGRNLGRDRGAGYSMVSKIEIEEEETKKKKKGGKKKNK